MMLDRIDLQLVICEQIMEMDIYELMRLVSDLTGHDLELADEEQDLVAGSLTRPVIDDDEDMRTWLAFLQHALKQRATQAG